jgi:hypothetical protein
MTPDLLLPTTELEAVNLMLWSIGESPVETLDDATLSDAESALALLRRSNRLIQTAGWHFNTDRKRLFTRDVDSFINLPPETLEVDTDGCNNWRDVQNRAGKLWDSDNNTFVFTEDLKLNIVLLKPFTEIPQAARDYITEEAGCIFQTGAVGSDLLYKFSEERKMQCRALLLRADNRTKDPNMLTGSSTVAQMVYGRGVGYY